MDLPPVSSFRTGQNGETTPAEFLTYLQTITNEHFNETNAVKIPASAKDPWIILILELSENFLAKFPASSPGLWNTLAEKTKLASATLEVLERAAVKVEDLLLVSDSRTQMIVLRLSSFLFALASWDESVIATVEDSSLSSSTLHSKAVDTTIIALKRLGGSHSPARLPSRFLVQILDSSIQVLHELPSRSLPLTMTYLDFTVDASDKGELSHKLTLDMETHHCLGSVLADLLLVASALCTCADLSESFMAGYRRDLILRAQEAADFLLSSLPQLSHGKRSEAISIVIRACAILESNTEYVSETIASIRTAILAVRMKEGPNVNWNATDNALLDSFERGSARISPECTFPVLVDLLDREEWGEGGVSLRNVCYTAMLSHIPSLDRHELQRLGEILPKKPTCEKSAILSFAVQNALEKADPNPDKVLGKRKRVEDSWRTSVITILRADIFGQSHGWLPVDGMQDTAWRTHVLEALKTKFSQSLVESSTETRVKMVSALQKLPCLVSHPYENDCVEGTVRPAIALIPYYLTCLSRLQSGPMTEVSCRVRKLGQDAMASCLKHHSQGYGEDHLDAVVEFVKSGLQSQDRSVRIASGRSLVELVRLYVHIGRGALKRIDSIFETIDGLVSAKEDAIKETAIVALGHLGRISESELLGRVLYRLIPLLDHNNILLKGLTYSHLLSLAKHHKRNPYSLVSPHMQRLAPEIVSVMPRQPNLLLEFCRFISLSPSDFLSVTLPHTLPRLFGSCNAEAIQKLGDELGLTVSAMFLTYSAEILAFVFSLNGTNNTEKGLNFIVRTLSEAAHGVPISLQSVVRSCLITLLGNLIVAMGDENRTIAENAVIAIHRVERSLIQLSDDVRKKSARHLGNFLKEYMLGIITNLSDMLQDVHGRKTEVVKRSVLRGLAALIREVGPPITTVAPQIMATLQTTVVVPLLSEVALRTWHTFLITLDIADLGPHVGPTTAALVNTWPSFHSQCREIAQQCISYIVSDVIKNLGPYVYEIVDLSSIQELSGCWAKVMIHRSEATTKEQLLRILERSLSDNTTVACQALEELKAFMTLQHEQFIRDLTSGDVFDPAVGQIMKALLSVACRDVESNETIRLAAFECMGILGAVDPDRFDIPFDDSDMVVRNSFFDEAEAIRFALHLIETALVGAFRSTSDIKYQSHLAYAIQELLKICKFTPSLVIPGTSVPIKVRNRWNALPKHVLETVTPLLEGKFAVHNPITDFEISHPIYHKRSTYREWIQVWSTHLITRTSLKQAKDIFDVFRVVVRNKDVGIAHQLLPHLVLNTLVSGSSEDTDDIRMEIIAVFEDQLDPSSKSSSDKKLLSAQTVFMLMDHLNKWIRIVRQDISYRRGETRRSRQSQSIQELEMQLSRVESILANIDQDLIAKAAFECKSYARSLMNFEKQILTLQDRGSTEADIQTYYERLHEIYAHLDEPDGMEGLSIAITSPSIEHQIRQHESTGKWTSAQSCWEVRLQQSPDKLEYHVGLLRCLRNLGHYDSLRTHIQGVLVRNPQWEDALSGFKVEGLLMNSDWETVQSTSTAGTGECWELSIARLLLAERSNNNATFRSALLSARAQIGAQITAAGERGYRRAYDSVLKLHLIRDIEMTRMTVDQLREGSPSHQVLAGLFRQLASRLDATLPTFRSREPILSMHRTTFALHRSNSTLFGNAIGLAWLESSKIARKAGHWQTAYSAVLQAQESQAPLSFFQRVKLIRASGEPLRALYDLDHALISLDETRATEEQHANHKKDIDEEEQRRTIAKAQLLRARWMRESDRFDANIVVNELAKLAKTLYQFESAHFHSGHFQDECYKSLGAMDKKNRGQRMNLFTVKAYAQAIRIGSKYTYQTIPRLLTLWLDMGEDPTLSQNDTFSMINAEIEEAVKRTPVYKWLTAFPQIVSRVDHKSPKVFEVLSRLIITVLSEYPQQGLWLFMSVVKSTKPKREKRGKSILDQLKNNPHTTESRVPALVDQARLMTTELLKLCDMPIKDDNAKSLSMTKDCPSLARLAPSPLIIPLQESMIASLPATSNANSFHQPFPHDAPTIAQFYDEIDIMKSLAKPRKITIVGDNGKIYMFLGKPKDDLRKDARLMDFNSIINKLLKTNSEARRRQLHIRTYSVVTLNEECGFIQWVPNTMPMRPILLNYYAARGVEAWGREMSMIFTKIKDVTDKEASKLFMEKVLKKYVPVFHEWFLDTFSEPTAWFTARLAYGRTAAVMSMVGFILGLGDRHLENILMDVNSGDVVHVDFNCLFEKGRTLETPERVPFRLTNNMVNALGVTGVEGTFRKSCEITMQLLRDNKDSLMSVLDAFIHDPLVEWEDEKRKIERAHRGDRNAVRDSIDLRKLAQNALLPIERKLKGMYTKEAHRHERRDKEYTTSNLVQVLIEEATDLRNLAKMYPGWAPWH